MLGLAVRNTKKLVREKVKESNVRLGRLFTKKDQAALLASYTPVYEKEEVFVLDPGAGTGILSAAAIEEIAKKSPAVRRIVLFAYETNADFLPMLADNLERIRKKLFHDYKVRLVANVKAEDYVTAARPLDGAPEGGFDLVICNPPRELATVGTPAWKTLKKLCSGDTDLAYLFAVQAVRDLAVGGRLSMVLPVSFASSAYLDKIRRYLFTETVIGALHLFLKESKDERTLDEVRGNMMISLTKGASAPELIRITTSYGDSATVATVMHADYDSILRRDTMSLLLIKSAEEAKILQVVSRFPATLSSLGLKMKTGLTIESRYKSLLRDKPTPDTVPLIHPNSIQLGQVAFPHPAVKNQYLVPEERSILQKNKNMLFIKRVPAKSDKKALFCGAYLASQLPRARYISTHNKLNYIDYADGREMDFNMVYGLFVVLNSSLYGKYYQIVSKSKQINATEFAELPLPSAAALRTLGANLALSRAFSEKSCDKLLLMQMKSGKL